MSNTLTTCESGCSTQAESRRTFIPRYQVRETESSFIVTAQIPGVDRSGIETTLLEDRLTVVAKRNWTKPEGWVPVHQEIPQADYRLDLEIGRRVNRDSIKAELNQGVLTLTLAKAEAVKPRKIEIAG